MVALFIEKVKFDGVVKTLHPESRRLAYLLRHCKFNVITTYLITPHSIKFTFLEYEVFYLAIKFEGVVKTTLSQC